MCLAAEGTLDQRAFEAWLEDVLWERGATGAGDDGAGGAAGADAGPPLEVLRAKGVLFVDDDDSNAGVSTSVGGAYKKMVLQAVREVYEITPGPPTEDGERPMNKVVLIGRGLSEAALLPGFEAAAATRGGG